MAGYSYSRHSIRIQVLDDDRYRIITIDFNLKCLHLMLRDVEDECCLATAKAQLQNMGDELKILIGPRETEGQLEEEVEKNRYTFYN